MSAVIICPGILRAHAQAERARALDVPKPPPVPDGQIDLFDMEVS